VKVLKPGAARTVAVDRPHLIINGIFEQQLLSPRRSGNRKKEELDSPLLQHLTRPIYYLGT
jgi:hypothetical protein